MRALLPWLLAAAAGSAGAQDTQPAWELDWQVGRREAAVDALQARVSGGTEHATLTLLLAERQFVIHRYAAALSSASTLGAKGSSIRARAHYLLGHYDLALELLDPADPVEALMLIDSHEVLGHGAQTIAALAAARTVIGDDDPVFAAAEGRAAARSGDHAAAVLAFRRALATDAYEHTALFGLGRSLLQLGEREEAALVLARHHELVPLMDQREHANRAIDLAPMHAPNHAQLGDVERAIGRLELAEQSYLRAAGLAKAAERTPVALRHARLLAEDRADLAAAVALLDRVAADVPDARLPVRAGDLLLAAGQARAALVRYDAAVQLRPDDAVIRQRRDKALQLLSAGTDGADERQGDTSDGPP